MAQLWGHKIMEVQVVVEEEVLHVKLVEVETHLLLVPLKERMEEMDGNERMEYKLQANRENVNKMIQHDDDELETHFVENPFIKLREKAQ